MERSRTHQRPLPSLARYGRPSKSANDGGGNQSSNSLTNRVHRQRIDIVSTGGAAAGEFKLPRRRAYLDAKPVVQKPAQQAAPAFSFGLEPAALAQTTPLSLASFNTLTIGQKLASAWRSYMLYCLALMILAAGVYVVIEAWQLNRRLAEKVGVISAQDYSVGAQVAEPEQSGAPVVSPPPDKPLVCDAHQGAPRAISLAGIGVRACVVPVGVNGQNQLDAPKNIHNAGWYAGGAGLASTAGAILIDGHAGSLEGQGVGVFKDLYKLRQKSEVQLEAADGAKTTFVVRQIRTVKTEEVNMGEMLRSVEPGKLGLNLITCAGTYSEETGFDSRVLVFAVQKT